MPKIVLKTGWALAAIASETYGTILPPTCAPGDTFLKTDATVGQMLYYCYATDTWQQTAGGGGGAVTSVFTRTGAVVAAANDYTWNDIASKPSTFAPSAHSHPESEVTNLVADLAGKQASLGFTPENAANKGAVSGYASLDAGVKVPIAQVPTGGSVTTVAALTSDFAENDTTSMVKITGLDLTVGAGTYTFEYYIRGRAADVLQSLKFAVNHTGTTTVFVYSLKWPSAGVTASTGAINQDAPAITTGSVYAHQSTRTKNTTLGPQTGVDTANADILFRITGLMIVTVSGNLELYHGSELAQANGTSVMAGTSLILTKTA